MFEQSATHGNQFLGSIERLHAAAKTRIAAGAGGRAHEIALLQTALTAEINCVLRYCMIAVSPAGLAHDWIGTEFLAQAAEERTHMSALAARISSLGGVPDFTSAAPAMQRPAQPDIAANLQVCLKENFHAEQEVMALYRVLLGYFGETDPETTALLTQIMEDEESHTSDMEDLLAMN